LIQAACRTRVSPFSSPVMTGTVYAITAAARKPRRSSYCRQPSLMRRLCIGRDLNVAGSRGWRRPVPPHEYLLVPRLMRQSLIQAACRIRVNPFSVPEMIGSFFRARAVVVMPRLLWSFYQQIIRVSRSRIGPHKNIRSNDDLRFPSRSFPTRDKQTAEYKKWRNRMECCKNKRDTC